jgi:hypothetical protein
VAPPWRGGVCLARRANTERSVPTTSGVELAAVGTVEFE